MKRVDPRLKIETWGTRSHDPTLERKLRVQGWGSQCIEMGGSPIYSIGNKLEL
jgi:hypothetical protein